MLFGANAGPFTAAVPFAIVAAPHGGWTQTQGPHGARLGDWLYYAAVNGSSGVLEVAGYNVRTGATIAAITVHAALTSDTHDAPSLHVRASDHKLMVYYSGHNGTSFWLRLSANSLDSDPTLSGGFASEANLDSQLGGDQYTYPYVGEWADGTQWLAYRDWDNPGTTERFLAIASSADGGATWDPETRLFLRGGGVIPYWFVHYGASRVDFAISNGNGVTDTHISLLHMYYQGGSYYKTDGTLIAVAPYFTGTNLTVVHDGTSYPNAWPSGMAIDDTSEPVILYETLDTANGHSYVVKYARWNGSSWDKTTVTTIDDTGLVLIAHSALDEASPNRCWVVKPVSGVYELFEYTTTDHGATWSGRQMTSGSASPGFLYPANVENPDSRIAGIVMKGGTYVDTGNFSVGVHGIGR